MLRGEKQDGRIEDLVNLAAAASVPQPNLPLPLLDGVPDRPDDAATIAVMEEPKRLGDKSPVKVRSGRPKAPGGDGSATLRKWPATENVVQQINFPAEGVTDRDQIPKLLRMRQERHGGFARYVTMPAGNCLPLPEGVDTELGALTEPLGVGCEAVLTGEVGLGDTVLVMGPGTIGQAIALFARAAGAGRVLVAGRADEPRFDVMRQLGFDDLLDVAEAPLLDLVMAATGGHKVDVVIEATGHPPTIVDGLGVLRTAGVLVVAGIHPGPFHCR